MSRQETLAPRGQLTGNEMIQESSDWIQSRYNNGGYIPTMSNQGSANYMGGRFLRSNYRNTDINGLSQPVGVIPNVGSRNYQNNVTGMDYYPQPIKGGGVTLNKLRTTDRFNKTGFTDPRVLGLSNDDLYRSGAPFGSQNYRINRSKGLYTTITNGIERNGGLVR